ncbi:hypothetical protein H0X06_01445 [Candidatus Dependentiae bacterium]|nr:hypothetical protein [Candidatus Dependentiae bacterium]
MQRLSTDFFSIRILHYQIQKRATLVEYDKLIDCRDYVRTDYYSPFDNSSNTRQRSNGDPLITVKTAKPACAQ